LFVPDVLKAVCKWSGQNDQQTFAMFFTIPDPIDYFHEAGFYGFEATGTDDAVAIEEALTHGNRRKAFLSIYDTSHRFIVLPESRAWMFIGDRDADLAIFGFSSIEQRQAFVSDSGIVMFDSVADAAHHAQSFMSYTLDMERLPSQ
jgi:hypothetical protein